AGVPATWSSSGRPRTSSIIRVRSTRRSTFAASSVNALASQERQRAEGCSLLRSLTLPACRIRADLNGGKGRGMVVGERREGDTVILTVQCPIDGFTARDVEQELLRRVEAGANRLIIDLGPVTYISSVGIGALILLHKRVQQANGRVVFCSLQES